MTTTSGSIVESLRVRSDSKFRERPILFSAPMVRALLAGTKTQTRRLVKPQPPSVEAVHAKAGIDYSWFTHAQHHPGVFCVAGPVWAVRDLGCAVQMRCPYGIPGDRLWVKETWHPCDSGPELYAADYASKVEAGVERWKPSLFMSRAQSRIDLEVTSVRVEQLHAITEDDARAEGVTLFDDEDCWSGTCRLAYEFLWGQINGFESWASNPWVWVVEFRRIKL